MTADPILDLLTSTLAEQLGGSRTIGPDTHILEELQLDSLQRLALIVEVENRFRICLGPEDEERLQTIGDLVSLIRSRIGHDAPE